MSAYILILLGLGLVATGAYQLLARQGEKQREATSEGTQFSLAETHPAARQNDPRTDKEKGNDFEDFVIQKIGRLPGISFLGKTADYHKNGITGRENRDPDLRFTYKGKPFAVECKWRSRFIEEKIQWAEDYQVKNYNVYAEKAAFPVYICIGVGGEPQNPAEFYFVPLKALKYGFGTREYLGRFRKETDKALLAELSRNR